MTNKILGSFIAVFIATSAQSFCFAAGIEPQDKSLKNEISALQESNEWDPLAEMEKMRQKIDKMFRDNFKKAAKEEKMMMRKESEVFEPALIIKETKDNYIINLDLPGMNREDINIELKDHFLTISGERKSEMKKENEKIIEEEKSFGYFSRTITLPQDVKASQISAEYKNGVLKISMPRMESAKKEEPGVKIQVK
ncbi:MAG: Hsp20/alpha crystallin family protein [Candidatus Omnitrophica bacterium]|nr:Hsp20/alpha crystallin family protein [Candidatus Omnitrophota bacterium]